MRLVVNDIIRFHRLQHSEPLPVDVLEVLVNQAENCLSARHLVEIVPEVLGVVGVLNFSDEAVDVKLLDEKGVSYG